MPDVRLIDANALCDVLDEGAYVQVYNSAGDAVGRKPMPIEFKRFIDAQPTIDAVPVKRGHWITTQKTIDDNITTCSNCKREFYIENLVEVGNENGYCEFCPSCGADMRGDTDADS